MATSSSSYWRDANRHPITTDGLTVTTTLTTNANNTTVNPPIFTLTGTIEVRALWGVVTTDLSSNHTAAYWRLNDQTTQSNISLNTGTTLSSFAAGSILTRSGLVATALTGIQNNQERVTDSTATKLQYFTPTILTKKTGALTQIEYVYTTTNAPATGAIQFFCRYLPLTTDGDLTGVAS